MPLISAIVPIYNVEKYLHRCIDSILGQTFTDFELILVDDGSIDNCGAICDEYARIDSRVRVFHQKNSGVSIARNTGIEESTGEYITFVDSDDYIDRDFFQDAISIINSTIVDIYLAGHRVMKNQGVVRTMIVAEDFQTSMQELSEYQMIDLLSNNYIASSCGKLISKQLIGETRFDSSMNFGEDLKFMHEIIQKTGHMYVKAKPYYFYWVEYRGGTNLTAVMSEKKCVSVIKTYRILFDLAKKWGNTSKYLEFISERWIKDFKLLDYMVFSNDMSLWQQHKMWSILRSDPELRKVLADNVDKRQRLYLEYPGLLLLKRKLSKIKRKLLEQ